MDKRTTGIIATIVTALLCGCPGLFALCFGLISASASFIPGAEIDVFGSNDPQSALYMGIGALCLGILFVAIPVVVGVLTLRKRPEPASSLETPQPPTTEEPLPPPH